MGQPTNKFVYYVDSNHVRKNTIVNDNVDSELITSMIRKAQDLRVDTLLGQNLSNRVKDAINSGVVTGDTLDLLNNFIAPCLTEYTLYEVLPYISLQVMNIGVVRKSSDNSDAATLEDINYLRKNVRSTADYYGERLTQHLCTNDTAFPEYADWTNGGATDGDDISPSRNNYGSGFKIL